MYYAKSLEASPEFYGNIVRYHLFPERSDSGLPLDATHAEEVLLLLLTYLRSYYSYCQQEQKLDDWKENLSMLKEGFQKLSKCYAHGKSVKRDGKKAKDYSTTEDDFIRMIYRNAAGNFTPEDIRLSTPALMELVTSKSAPAPSSHNA